MPEKKEYSPGSFCWAELSTTDLPAAERFYSELFGWKAEDASPGGESAYALMTLRGQLIAGACHQDEEQLARQVPPSWMGYVSVSSANEAVERARSLGARIAAEPFDVMEVGRMAVLCDPTGATLALWQAGEHRGSELGGEPGTTCWFELCTGDVAAAKDFYGGLFGWECRDQEMGSLKYTVLMRGEEAAGGLMQTPEEWGPMPASWMVYFAVADCDADSQRAESLGGRICVPPADIPGVGRFATLLDPQGAAFSIIQLQEEA